MPVMSGAELAFRPADPGQPPRVAVIAELGVNHDGGPGRAVELIHAAAEAGADGVKLQYFCPERLLSEDARLARYQEPSAGDPRTLLAQLALSFDTVRQLRQVARAAGLGFVLTPFHPDDCRELASLELDAVKVASPDAVNSPLLEAAGALQRPLLVSTGTCRRDELSQAAAAVRDCPAGGALLQCVSSYPTPMEQAALGGIARLRDAFGLAVGYSDHTPGLDTGALAVAAGACVLEKHLTWDQSAPGPDHATSLEAGQFAEYARRARQAAKMLGPLQKQPLEIEEDVATVSRQSVCLREHRPAGHVLDRQDLTIKRPGTGIPAGELHRVFGRKLKRAVAGNRLLHWTDLT